MLRGPTHSRAISKVRSGCSDLCQLNFENLWGWRFHILSGHPPPGFRHSHGDSSFPYNQGEFSLLHVLTVASHRFSMLPWEELGFIFLLPTQQGVEDCNLVPLSLLFSRWTKTRPLHFSLHGPHSRDAHSCSSLHSRCRNPCRSRGWTLLTKQVGKLYLSVRYWSWRGPRGHSNQGCTLITGIYPPPALRHTSVTASKPKAEHGV